MKNEKKLSSLLDFKIKETKMTDVKGMGFTCTVKDISASIYCCGNNSYKRNSSGSWIACDCD